MIRKILLYLLPFLSFSAEAMLNYRIEEAPVSATLTAYSRPASPAYDYNPPAWDSGPAFSVDVQQNSFRQEDFAQTTAPDAFSVLQTQISQATDEGLCSQDFLLSKLNDVETQIKTLTECDTQYNKLCDQAAVLRAEGHELTHAEIIRYTQVENWHKQTLESLQKAQKCEQLLLQKMHAIQRQDTKELADFRAKVFTSATPKQLEELQSSLQTERDLTHSKIALATCQRDAKIAEHTEIGNAWRARHGGDPHADSFVIAKRKEISELQQSAKLIDKKLELVSHELTLRKEAAEKTTEDLATLARIKNEFTQLKTDIAAQEHSSTKAVAAQATEQVERATEIAARYPQEASIQQKTKDLIQLQEALDMISTPQHILGEVENPYAGVEALKKVGRTMQSFAQGAGHGILGFGDMANQAITDPQKAASDLYQALSTTVDTYLKQKEAIYNQCTGDFSRANELLKDAPDSVKKYYDTVAQHYRCEYANIRPGEREIEAWVVGDILKDQQRAEWWESVKQMSSEEIAYHAGKLTAETILTDGAMRVVGSALQVARLEGGALYQIAKKGTGDLAATTVAKTAHAAQKITLTADQLGTKMAQKVAGESTEVTAAGTEGVFKTTIKNPGVAEACESIAKNPPKMAMVKDTGLAGAVKQCRETILPKMQTFEQARNKALELAGNLGPESKPYIGALEKSAGFGKIIGRISSDNKIRWYLDYDPIKGLHFNVHDFRFGKGINATKYAIPFEGTEKTYKTLLKHLQ